MRWALLLLVVLVAPLLWVPPDAPVVVQPEAVPSLRLPSPRADRDRDPGVAVLPTAKAGHEVSRHRATPAPLPAADFNALARCESSNNPAAVSSSGKYRGLYQFDQRTWDAVARRHRPAWVGLDPARQPRTTQTQMAAWLYQERGREPWPVCGREL